MTSTELGQLFDDATAELPPEVARPPLDAIHRRVGRRRARFAVGFGTVAVLAAVAIAVPLLGLGRHDRPQPAVKTLPVGWQFGMVDGTKLSIFATRIGDCMNLTGTRTEVAKAGDTLTVTLHGTPTRGADCSQSGMPLVQVELGERFAGELVRDGADGQLRPVYDRAELPVGFRGPGTRGFGWGVERVNRGPVEFTGDFQMQKALSPPFGLVRIGFKGTGLSQAPLSGSVGEPMVFGSISGWLVGDDRAGYRFVWQRPRGGNGRFWIGYELGSQMLPYSRADLIDRLNSLVWP